MAEDKLTIPVELVPELREATSSFHRFLNRVRGEFRGGTNARSSTMESLFFAPGAKSRNLDAAMRDMGRQFSAASRKIGSATKNLVPPKVATTVEDIGKAFSNVGKAVSKSMPTMEKARKTLQAFRSGAQARRAGGMVSSPFATMEKMGYGAQAFRERMAPRFRGAMQEFRAGYQARRAGISLGEGVDPYTGRGVSWKARLGGMAGGATRGASALFKPITAELKGFARYLKDNTKTLQRWGRAMGQSVASVARFSTTLARGAGRVTGALGRGLRGAGRYAGRAGLGLAGGLFGFAMGGLVRTYQEGIAAHTETMAARMEGAQAQGVRGGGFGGGPVGIPANLANRWGYKMSEAEQLRTQAARQGFRTRSEADVGRLMQIQRGVGEPGVTFAAGLMRRGGKGVTAEQSFRQLSGIMAVGMASGLEKARIPELLSAANDYAERQIEAFPDAKDSARQFALALSRMQESGVPGLQGKYGAALLNKMDQAIKGATGVNQAFVMRSMGFGRGTSYYDALKAQQEGALGRTGGRLNIERVVEQMGREYGTGEAGAIAMSKFANISIKAAEEMRKIFGDTGLSQKQKEEAAKQVMRREEDAKIPSLEREAYAVIKEFGGPLKTAAMGFNKILDKMPEIFKIKEAMTALQASMSRLLAPLLQFIGTYLPKITNYLMAIFQGITGFIGGYSGAKWGSKTKAGYEGMVAGFHEARGQQRLQEFIGQKPGEALKRLQELKPFAEEVEKKGMKGPIAVDIGGQEFMISPKSVKELIQEAKAQLLFKEAMAPLQAARPAVTVKTLRPVDSRH